MDPTVPTCGTGLTVIVWQLAALNPQALLAVQQMRPEVFPKVTVIDLVPCPETMVAPVGTVHVLTGAGLPLFGTVYTTFDCPLQTVVSPVMPPGVGGGPEFTVTVTVALFVHPFALLAVTEYVVLAVGAAITVVPVLLLRPAEGAHK